MALAVLVAVVAAAVMLALVAVVAAAVLLMDAAGLVPILTVRRRN
jgi:hypothetical protein